jgi:hypothetical protein
MFRGVLIAESLRVGAKVDGIPLVVRAIYRVAPPSVAPEQPPIWTMIEFEVEDGGAEALAIALTTTLDQPGWYCDYQSKDEHIVAFPQRSFRYRRGDQEARAEAQAYGRSVGLPEAQLDWRD